MIEKGIAEASQNRARASQNGAGASQNGAGAIPDTLDDQTVETYKNALRHYFAAIDKKKCGYFGIVGLKQFLDQLNLSELNDSEVVDIYLDMDKRPDGELDFEHLFQYFRSIIVMENELSPAKVRLFEAMLTADHLNQCNLGGITQFLNKTWAQFSQYRRYGQNGQLVMSSGDNISIVQQGTHALIDLICWPDSLAIAIVPEHVVITEVRICLKTNRSS